MDTFAAAASQFDPEAITPAHVIVAILLNLIWVTLMVRDRRRAARAAVAEELENPE